MTHYFNFIFISLKRWPSGSGLPALAQSVSIARDERVIRGRKVPTA